MGETSLHPKKSYPIRGLNQLCKTMCYPFRLETQDKLSATILLKKQSRSIYILQHIYNRKITHSTIANASQKFKTIQNGATYI